MGVLVFFCVLLHVTDTLFWDLAGNVLAAPGYVLCSWKTVILSNAMHWFYKQIMIWTGLIHILLPWICVPWLGVDENAHTSTMLRTS